MSSRIFKPDKEIRVHEYIKTLEDQTEWKIDHMGTYEEKGIVLLI